jgi:ABC-type polysaccharide/polyol phosphate export permease
MRLRVSSSGPLKVDDLADDASLVAEDLNSQRIRRAFGLAWGLIGLIGLVLLLVALFGLATYPDDEIALVRAGPDEEATLAAIQDLRDSWFSQVKDLLQLLVVSILVPLLTTLIGYIFGRSAAGE